MSVSLAGPASAAGGPTDGPAAQPVAVDGPEAASAWFGDPVVTSVDTDQPGPIRLDKPVVPSVDTDEPGPIWVVANGDLL